MVGFKGAVSVATRTYKFARGNMQARVIYISPYGDIENFLISLKRAVVGVQFTPKGPTGHIARYVLGLLPFNDPNYAAAAAETRQALAQKRRFIVAIADEQTISLELEEDRGWFSRWFG
jgi:hypothetical protein